MSELEQNIVENINEDVVDEAFLKYFNKKRIKYKLVFWIIFSVFISLLVNILFVFFLYGLYDSNKVQRYVNMYEETIPLDENLNYGTIHIPRTLRLYVDGEWLYFKDESDGSIVGFQLYKGVLERKAIYGVDENIYMWNDFELNPYSVGVIYDYSCFKLIYKGDYASLYEWNGIYEIVIEDAMYSYDSYFQEYKYKLAFIFDKYDDLDRLKDMTKSYARADY